jgi:hypothetical protein
MFSGYGGDEAAFGGLGMSGRGQLQIPESERAKVVWRGGQYEEQVVQELWKVPLEIEFPPLGFL